MAQNELIDAAHDGFRLPGTVRPEHYALTIRPEFSDFTFQGGVVIDVKINKPVRSITLNAAELSVSNAFIDNSDGTRLPGTIAFDEQRERVVISFDGKVGSGFWRLHLSFAGSINNKLQGLYRSNYKDAAGNEHVMAITQLFANDARRVFPCFDEPSFKAGISLTLVVDPHLTAVANAPIKSETLVEELPAACLQYSNGLRLVTPARMKRVIQFERTINMSTYIGAFVVGELESTEPLDVDGTAVRIYCVPGKKHLTGFALKMAEFALRWYEKYFGIKYPAKKLDMLGIPDVAYGAMENLGCIVYRETALLVDEDTATVDDLQRVADTVAHEISHQWFGNLVTMKWWNGLWLNEAFATFMATKVMHDFRPEWKVWTNFGIERSVAYRVDALAASRSIEAEVIDPADALGMVDAITYRKGCSVLRQLEQFIGEETFRQGIARYLYDHAYGNTDTGDLWASLDSVATVKVSELMHGWVFQPGFPLVTVSEGTAAGEVVLSQRQFRYLASDDANALWQVPVFLRYGAGGQVVDQSLLLDAPEKTITLPENFEWLVVNAGGNGYYRTRYSATLSAKLTANMQSNLQAIERFNLVNDAWDCVQAGLLGGRDYLDMVRLFNSEADPSVWSVITTSLNRLHGLLPADRHAGFEQMVRDLAAPAFARVGWDVRADESAQDKQLRYWLVSVLGTGGGDTAVRDTARRLFAKYQTDKSALAADVVPAVVRLAARSGDSQLFDHFTRLATGSANPQEAERYLLALADFRDNDLLERALAATVDGTARGQDVPYLFVRLLGNPVIGGRAWQFAMDNWKRLGEVCSETGLIDVVEGVSSLDTPELELSVTEFFAATKVKGADRSVAQSLEMLRVAVLLRQREGGSLSALFSPDSK